MARRKLWLKADDAEVKEAPDSVEPVSPVQAIGRWLRLAANVTLCLILVGTVLSTMWLAVTWMHRPTYSVIQAKFRAAGRTLDGQRIAELGRVCMDGSETPLACGALYDSPAPLSGGGKVVAQYP